MIKLHKADFENWSACLYLLLQHVRKEGLFSIEQHLNNPEESTIFIYSKVLQGSSKIPLEFTTNIMELFLMGVNQEELTRNVEKYINAILDYEKPHKTIKDQSIKPLLDFIWETILCSINGNPPKSSLMLGRLSIPLMIEFSKNDLENVMQKCKTDFYQFKYEHQTSNIDEEIDKFISSISK